MAVKPTLVPSPENAPASPSFQLPLLEKLPALLWTTDKNFLLTSLAGGELSNLSINAASYLNTPVDLLFQKPQLSSKVRDAHFLAASGESCSFEFEIAGRDFQGQVSPLLSQDGQIQGVIGIAVDQTERLVGQRALRLSEQNYRLLIEEAPHAICRFTPAGSLLQVNRAMLELLGYPESDLLILNLRSEVFCEPEQFDEFAARVKKSGSVHTFEAQWLGHDRKMLQVSLGGRAVNDAAGDLIYVDLFAENITERKQLEEQLLHAQKMQAIGQLAGGIAHDFNNLLTVIRGQAEMMGEEMLSSDPLSPRLEELERAAERATSLTRQLLAFSRRQVLQAKVIDLNSVVEDMNQMLARLIGENIELIFNPASGLWPVKIDPGQIEQVLMNLAVNARDAMPNGGRLIIETRNMSASKPGATQIPCVLGSDCVLLTVADTGHGMDEQTRARIFEPFFTTKQVGKGTGLGLSVVYGVVKQSGGQIRVESAPGDGTIFHIYLPRTEAFPEDKPHVSHGKMSGGTETILLAEDDEPIRHMLVMFLRNHGYHVLVASDGIQAEQLAQNQKIDILLSDMMMPRMNGRDLARKVKKSVPGAKVILMSGHTEDPPSADEGIHFLQKPFSMHALSSLLRDVVSADRPE